MSAKPKSAPEPRPKQLPIGLVADPTTPPPADRQQDLRDREDTGHDREPVSADRRSGSHDRDSGGTHRTPAQQLALQHLGTILDTLRGAPHPLAAAPAVLGPLPPPRCEDCRVVLGADPLRLRLCQPCLVQRRRRARTGQLLRVWAESVPRSFGWARFGDERLRERTTIGDDDLARLVDATGSVLLIGPSGSGKTSLAVAKLRQAFSAARAVCDQPSNDRFRTACGAFFASATRLARAGMEHRLGAGRPPLVDRCVRSTLLVLDEMGMDQQILHATSSTSVAEVLHERHAVCRPTIVTTFLSERQMADHYGAGIARRLAESLVITLRGAR